MADHRPALGGSTHAGFTPGGSDAPRGYAVSASRTIGADTEAVFRAWTDERRRRLWLRPDQLALTEKHPVISLHATWGNTRVRVFFMPRGATRTNVTVDHDMISTGRKAEQLRKFWLARLGRLAAALEGVRH